jgi:hypothetical protein
MPGWLGLLLGALATWGGLRVWSGHPRPEAPARRLARRELAFLAAAADAMYPPGGEVPASGREAGVPAYTDRYVDAVPAGTRRLMRMLFFLVEHATLLFPAPGASGWRRFSSLSATQRVAVLEGWRTSRLFPRRLVFNSLRAILTMGYFSHPPVLRALRLAPFAIESPIREADCLYPRVGAHPDSIPWSPGQATPPGPQPPLDPDGPVDPRYAEAAS